MFRTTNKTRLTLTCLDRRDVPAIMPSPIYTAMPDGAENEVAQMAATLSDKTVFVLQYEPTSDAGASLRPGPTQLELGTPTREAKLLAIEADGEMLGVATANTDRE